MCAGGATQLHNGTVVMNSRDYSSDAHSGGHQHRAISWSDDGGNSFSLGYRPPSLPDPIVEGAMTTDRGGDLLVRCEPIWPTVAFWRGGR